MNSCDYTTPSAGNDAVLADLSGRERDVFLLTAKGLGNSEIAASLVLSEATVKSHVGSILAKLRLKNRIQLVAFAYENGLLN
jgi:DNA-binding NarL/FixJ family response regulator